MDLPIRHHWQRQLRSERACDRMSRCLLECRGNYSTLLFIEVIAKDGERDKYFDAQEAKAYGLVDEVASFPDKSKK